VGPFPKNLVGGLRGILGVWEKPTGFFKKGIFGTRELGIWV